MQYSESEFYQLLDAANEHGADHLDQSCPTHREFEFSGPRQLRPEACILRYCGKDISMFAVKTDVGGDEPLQVCAVDDALGAWPRFGGDRLGTLSTRALFAAMGDKLYKDDPRALGA